MKNPAFFDNSFLKELGVIDWGYTEEAIPKSFSHFEEWISHSSHLPLGYLADHRRHLRSDLRLVFPEFQSGLVFLFSYQKTKKWMLENNKHSLASYALGFEGEDYHLVLKQKLNSIVKCLNLPDLKFLLSLDTQPILERDLAYRAGLGWFGKNSMLIHKKEGSYFIIGSILLNKKLDLFQPDLETDHCGHCEACIEACPTQAIDPVTRTLVSEKCLSTYTIEVFKDSPPPDGFNTSRGEIFGCDICQDVCPWNKKPLTRVISELNLKNSYSFIKEWFFEKPLEELYKTIEAHTNRGLKKKLYGTALARPGREGWLKNLRALLSLNNFLKKHKDGPLPPPVGGAEETSDVPK